MLTLRGFAMLATVQYYLDLFFFPIGRAPLPWVPLMICVLIAAISPSRHLAETRVGYLGFAFFALLVALFQVHLYVDGGEIFMAWGLFLLQFVILGSVAVAMTLRVRSNTTLWSLTWATAALAVFQALAFARLIGQPMDWIARGYVVGVLAASVYGCRDWRSGRT
jgi:hypothetical protein